MRPSATTGDAWPAPGSGTFQRQATASQSRGSATAPPWPAHSAPRHRGQSAGSPAGPRAAAATTMAERSTRSRM